MGASSGIGEALANGLSGFIRTNIAKKACTADGSPQRIDDHAIENGIKVQRCASKIVEAIEKKKFEVNIGGKEVSGAYIKRVSPNYCTR